MANVVLFANTKPRFATYLPVLREVANAGHDVTLYRPPAVAPSDEELAGFSDLNIQPASGKDVKSLSAADVFISSEDASAWRPSNAKSVAIIHSLPDRDLLRTSYHVWLRMHPHICAFDYLFASVRQPEESWNAQLYKKEIAPGGVLDDFTVVPGGYPKLDYLRAALGGAPELDSVIYCPTSANNAASGVSAMGSRIIRCLHDALPGRTVIFRPYPEKSDELINRVADECKDLPRFVLDRSATGMAYQKRALFTVTDKSSSSLSFSLASGRPSLFVDNEGFEGNSVERTEIGYNVRGEQALRQCAVECGNAPHAFADSIRVFAESRLYNLFGASKYIADNIDVFAAGGQRPDWLRVPRH